MNVIIFGFGGPDVIVKFLNSIKKVPSGRKTLRSDDLLVTAVTESQFRGNAKIVPSKASIFPLNLHRTLFQSSHFRGSL